MHYDDNEAIEGGRDFIPDTKTNSENKRQFGHAMNSSQKAMGLSSETHHIAKETR